MLGYIDNVYPRKVRGWASDRHGKAVEITIAVNGRRLSRLVPGSLRPDLETVFGRSMSLGFEAEVPCLLSCGDVVEVTGQDGTPLENSPFVVESLAGGKFEKALARVDRSMRILEIGPSFSPTAPRSAGWNSFSLDHATQEELRAKYADQAVELIEPVDFIWRGGPIADAVPTELHGSFDCVLASHVIEHFPDPISFFLSAAKLLKDGGVVSLVVPDKRVMFDFFKSVSMTSDLLTAYRRKSTRHTRKVAFDNGAYNIVEQGEIAWYARPMHDFSFIGGAGELKRAKQMFDESVEDETAPYVDYHHTVYTPSSFELIILELGQLGVIPFKVDLSYPTNGCEFYVTLRKGAVPALPPETLAAERLKLMKGVIFEQAEQAKWLSAP